MPVFLKVFGGKCGAGLGSHDAGGYMGGGVGTAFALKAHKGGCVEKGCERLKHFHIGVEVDAAFAGECVEARHVGDEGVFAGVVGLTGIGVVVDGEVGLVPLPDLEVGAQTTPPVNIASGGFREVAAAEPAVMECAGYHQSAMS